MRWMILILVAFGLGCGDDESTRNPDRDMGMADMAQADVSADMGPDADEEVDPFDVWREMRETLRQDPGYLRYERDRLVDAGDPAAMHEFVRDRIRTVPTRHDAWGPPNEILYGTRGALRYGEGSMRDKAELLLGMLTDAGFEAEVRHLLTVPADFTQEVLRAREASTVDIDEELVSKWNSQLVVEPSVEFVDPDGTAARELAGRIIDALPAETTNDAFDDTPPSQIPILRFRESPEAEWRLANLFMPGVALGESPTVPQTASAFSATEGAPVEFELRLHMTSSRVEGEVLLSASIPAHVLAGRQLTIGAAPAGELEDTLLQPIDSFTSFIPVISLQGIDVDDVEREEYTFVGNAFTLRGDQIQADADGNVAVDGLTLAEPLVDPDLSSVESVEVAAEAPRFSEVTLRVDVTDADGDFERLPASAFVIEDNGERVAPVLLQNEKRPRVLFITDRSGSVPEEFRGASAASLLVDIATTVQTANPRAEFRNLVIGTNLDQFDWTSDITDLQTQLTTGTGDGSNFWTALADGVAARPTTCVMITDGEPTDMPTDALLGRIDRMPPCVFLRAGGDPTITDLQELADINGGAYFEVSDVVAAREAVLDFVAERTQTYRLRYTARDRTPGEHTVQVEVGTTSATTTYEAPEAESPAQIWGYQLVMRQGLRDPARRMLAGSYYGMSDPLSIGEAQDQLVAARRVAFEGGSPIIHEVYDELLDNRLQIEPLVRAVAGEDEDELMDRLVQGARFMPPELLALTGPDVIESPTYSDGLRAFIAEEQLVGPREKVSSVDIVSGPGFGTRAVSDDSLAESIAASVRSSLVEAALYETATITLLEGEELTYLANESQLDTVFASLTEEERQAWRIAITPYRQKHLVVPADGSPIAFYSVDPNTGYTTGVLADGTGGGRTATELRAQLDQVIAFLSWLGFGGGVAGASVGFGFWIALSKAIAKNILIATIAIVEMKSPVVDLWGDAGDIACDVIKGTFSNTGAGAKLIVDLDALHGAAAGTPIIDCPF